MDEMQTQISVWKTNQKEIEASTEKTQELRTGMSDYI
jgi:hypothetical protein